DDQDHNREEAAGSPGRPPGEEEQEDDGEGPMHDDRVVAEGGCEPSAARSRAPAGAREPHRQNGYEPDEDPGYRRLREQRREHRPDVARRGSHRLRFDEAVDDRVADDPADREDEEPHDDEAPGDVANRRA